MTDSDLPDSTKPICTAIQIPKHFRNGKEIIKTDTDSPEIEYTPLFNEERVKNFRRHSFIHPFSKELPILLEFVYKNLFLNCYKTFFSRKKMQNDFMTFLSNEIQLFENFKKGYYNVIDIMNFESKDNIDVSTNAKIIIRYALVNEITDSKLLYNGLYSDGELAQQQSNGVPVTTGLTIGKVPQIKEPTLRELALYYEYLGIPITKDNADEKLR